MKIITFVFVCIFLCLDGQRRVQLLHTGSEKGADRLLLHFVADHYIRRNEKIVSL
jgi:hypothetical protein